MLASGAQGLASGQCLGKGLSLWRVWFSRQGLGCRVKSVGLQGVGFRVCGSGILGQPSMASMARPHAHMGLGFGVVYGRQVCTPACLLLQPFLLVVSAPAAMTAMAVHTCSTQVGVPAEWL